MTCLPPAPVFPDGRAHSQAVHLRYHQRMGFNPFRKQERRIADLVMVAGALLLTAVLVIWAFLGG